MREEGWGGGGGGLVVLSREPQMRERYNIVSRSFVLEIGNLMSDILCRKALSSIIQFRTKQIGPCQDKTEG